VAADTHGMLDAPSNADPDAASHFSCALSAVALARVRRYGGEQAVARALELTGSARTLAYLEEIGNWISYEEMVAIWQAGAQVTGDERFARHSGEDAVSQLGSSATSVVLRGLGSPEELLRQVELAGRRFSTGADLEAIEVRPGFAEIRATAASGFERHPLHCEWTQGMLTQSTALFGLPPATVEHPSCQSRGDPQCRYLVHWETSGPLQEENPAARVAVLEGQLKAMSERLESVFATAADLIASGELDETLARITERAALQVRAPRYLLAVRLTPDSPVLDYHKGLDREEGREVAERVLSPDSGAPPDHWLSVPVRSQRNHYGYLVAIYEEGARFFPQERDLLEVYARYAAAVLDSAAALDEAQERQREAQRRYEEAHALLDLARQLADAGSSEAVAGRLADAVPSVIDCDRASVYLWDDRRGGFVRQAIGGPRPGEDGGVLDRLRPEQVPRLASLLERPDPEPLFVELDDSEAGRVFEGMGVAAAVTVPIATQERLLGCLIVSVWEGPERLSASRDLRDRLSGVAAHAVTALENGRLVDRITHQARHDQLTDLLNRTGFWEALTGATRRALQGGEPLGLFFCDLDGFKAVNDEFGHETGDRLLAAVGARLAQRLRPTDIAARLGGDEFAVLVERLGDEEGAARLEARLRGVFELPFAVGRQSFPIRASIGRAVWPLDVDDPEELLRFADDAMYEAKRRRLGSAGPNR
jgi:diguanylate cyclase (GGDEF)-like protein